MKAFFDKACPERTSDSSPPIYWRVKEAAATTQVLKGRMKDSGFQSDGSHRLTNGLTRRLKPSAVPSARGFLHHPTFPRPINWRATVGHPFGIRGSVFRVPCSEFRVPSSEFRVPCSVFKEPRTNTKYLKPNTQYLTWTSQNQKGKNS